MMTEAIIFALIQSLAINGFYQSMEEGMIFNPYKKWLQRLPKWVGYPMGLCIKCMASVGSAVTFWPTVLYLYGWHPFEIFAWGVDIFVLVFLNIFFYKKG